MRVVKKALKSVFFTFTLCGTATLIGQIGCMDKSKHLNEKYDYKTYHYVHCTCDCQRYAQSSDRGLCSECGHYHDPGSWEIVGYNNKIRLKKSSSENK